MKRYIWCLGLLLAFLPYSKLAAQNFPGLFFKKPVRVTMGDVRYPPVPSSPKFSDSAQTAWISVYNDPINGDDQADAMTMDNEGNIYVTGNCSDSGATYGWDITTIKYNSDGIQQWLVSFDGPGHGDDVPYAIAVDNHENIYVSGYSDENGEYDYDFFTMKIDSSGEIAWSKLFANGPQPKNDVSFSVAVDESGSVYSTGATFVLATGDFDLTTIKYSNNGDQQWVQQYNSPFGLEDTGEDIILDQNNNIYITGVSQQGPGNYDVITLKYNNSGSLQWVQRYNGPGNSNDGGRQLILDPDLNVIVTGQQTGAGSLFDMLTLKYQNDGTPIWASTYNGSGNSEDGANALVCDGTGNIYITGFSTGTNNTSDYTTIKYTPGGSLVWTSFYTGPANGFEQAYDIALDNTDGVYITGYSPSEINPYVHYEYATVKYDTSGQEQWVSRYGGNSRLSYEPNVAKALSLDDYGNVYVTGEIADEGVGEDFGTIKYTQSVVPVELTSFNAVNRGSDILLNWSTATEINNLGFEVQKSDAADENPHWESLGFVNGYGTTTKSHSYSYTYNNVIKGKYNFRLKQTDLDGSYRYSRVVTVEIFNPEVFSLQQNFPNPFNPTTTISYRLPVKSVVTLNVYNALGEKEAALVNEEKQAGSYQLTWNASNLPSGVYFYQLRAVPVAKQEGDFVQSMKMILLK